MSGAEATPAGGGGRADREAADDASAGAAGGTAGGSRAADGPGDLAAARIAAARAYVDALVSHDASTVPLTPDAVRYEVGVKTGRSGSHIRRSLERGPQFRVIAAVRGFSADVDGDTVRTRYVIDTALAGRNFVVAEVAEDFRTDLDGEGVRIRRIDARIRPRRGPDLRLRPRG